ncbi:MAG: 1,4-dihydroxy-2-naphthoate octaprenyltransferase [Dehalococcoidia bacterium]|nr:1,4-dihydroxy-2-naphthoate octaprenyltransferase [Dehalococcoidia bacterium]
MGTLLAAYDDHFTWWLALLTLVGSLAIHAGTNLVNDYFDHVKGADSEESLGPAGFIQRGMLSPRAVLTGGILCFAGGSIIGLVLVAATDISLLWLGVASVLAGFLYTGWPLHLAYVALGEVTVFIFMGPVMVERARCCVQTETWAFDAFLASLPIAFLVTAILQANNIRDIESDRRVGKRTLATILGRTGANWEMYLLLGGAYVSLVVAVLLGALPWPALIALVTLPAVRPIVRICAAGGNPVKLNGALARSAQLHMRFGAVLSLGLGIALVLDAV